MRCTTCSWKPGEGKAPSQRLLTWRIQADEPGCNARHEGHQDHRLAKVASGQVGAKRPRPRRGRSNWPDYADRRQPAERGPDETSRAGLSAAYCAASRRWT